MRVENLAVDSVTGVVAESGSPSDARYSISARMDALCAVSTRSNAVAFNFLIISTEHLRQPDAVALALH